MPSQMALCLWLMAVTVYSNMWHTCWLPYCLQPKSCSGVVFHVKKKTITRSYLVSLASASRQMSTFLYLMGATERREGGSYSTTRPPSGGRDQEAFTLGYLTSKTPSRCSRHQLCAKGICVQQELLAEQDTVWRCMLQPVAVAWGAKSHAVHCNAVQGKRDLALLACTSLH